ncbi:DUF6965 family protein [Niabella sp. 22666]|uniref:DUF6965 family protein n=1 Tax=Niabella sp. 22666 TaxID=3453954 RepID=UPI003F864B07
MVNTIELLEIEKWFNSINIPKEVKINAGVRHTDAPKFVQENIELLKGKELTGRIADQRWNMLQELKQAILDPVK